MVLVLDYLDYLDPIESKFFIIYPFLILLFFLLINLFLWRGLIYPIFNREPRTENHKECPRKWLNSQGVLDCDFLPSIERTKWEPHIAKNRRRTTAMLNKTHCCSTLLKKTDWRPRAAHRPEKKSVGVCVWNINIVFSFFNLFIIVIIVLIHSWIQSSKSISWCCYWCWWTI